MSLVCSCLRYAQKKSAPFTTSSNRNDEEASEKIVRIINRAPMHIQEMWIQGRIEVGMWKSLLAFLVVFPLLLTACDFPALAVVRVPEQILSFPPAQGASHEWSTYLFNTQHSGFDAAETSININTASRLKQYWSYHANGGISVQPVEANGMIYWGSWDGMEHATNMQGHEVWETYLGKTNSCLHNVGVANTATLALVTIGGQKTPIVFVAGGSPYFYALNASNGKIIWKTLLATSKGAFLWGSSILYHDSIYIGVSSVADCPTVQGKLMQLSTTTGAIEHVFDVVPHGCQGGAIWSTPTVDEDSGDIYFSTGNPDICSTTEPYATALVELHASNLAYVSSWQVPASQAVDDSDFGSAPTLFTASIGGVQRALVGIGHKNGRYYALLRGALSRGPLWTKKVAKAGGCPECGDGTISPSAWDGSKLYVAGGITTINGVKCHGSVRALNPATGAYLWQACLTSGTVLAAVTMVPGIVVVEDGSKMVLLNAASGKPLFSYKDSTRGSVFYGAASFYNGMLFVGNFDGNLYAFGL
jgi:outer membrane protein assembly factor BamB